MQMWLTFRNVNRTFFDTALYLRVGLLYRYPVMLDWLMQPQSKYWVAAVALQYVDAVALLYWVDAVALLYWVDAVALFA